MNIKCYFAGIILMVGAASQALAQDDMDKLLEAEEVKPAPVNVEATFKGTRLINGHSVETRRKGNLDFIISHRFGRLNEGGYQLWGLDESNIRIGLDYAWSNNFTTGFGRNSFEKTYDGYLKYRVLRQKTDGGFPLSVTAFSSVAIKTLRDATYQDVMTFADRLAFSYQLLIARKFNPSLSLQLMPSIVHFNTIYPEQLNHDIFALGAGGRLKVTKRMSINAEYYYRFNSLQDGTHHALAIGIDLETGGHVFQLQFTNATSMIEKGFISEIRNDFFKGDIHFGFNVARTFQVKKK